MENLELTPWPVTVSRVRITKSDYVRNNQKVETETYLVYIKKDPFDTSRALVQPLYKGEHDDLIAFYDGATTEADGDDKVITPKALEALVTARAEKWAAMTEIQKKTAARLVVAKWPADEESQKAVGEMWAMLPIDWGTSNAWDKNPAEGSKGVIFGNLPIGDGTEKFYVIDKEGKEIERTQGARKGQKVTQTHADVLALVKRHGDAWVPLNNGATMQQALEIELQNQIQRDRFRKAESTTEVLARIAAEASAAQAAPATETPAPATDPAPEAPATTTPPTA